MASWWGHLDIVRLLLDRGANVDAAGRVSRPSCQAAPLLCLHGATVYMQRRIERGRVRRRAGWVVGAARVAVRRADLR